ncbi:helix-turn-helix transcriptional regulator [Vibrio mexicanus]|uniref:helix-turn-helix transcriptional regulator n=1 Tax=Vibrio mexicanus TaxID=1004326 RepID=UPI00063C1EA2|nr:WYL domain-containing protein [Vibrio mexicanus]
MAKSSFQDKKRRHDEILSCLRDQSYWTALELSKRVGTSQRTLMRDLAELRESGIPIESERGKGGGISLRGRWGIGRLQLSSSEVVSLLLALTIAESINSPILQSNLSSIRNRISASFPEHQRRNIEELRSRIQIGGNASAPVINSYDIPNHAAMPVISQAFLENKMLEIEYISETQKVTKRVVEPQILLLNWPVWYVLCWDKLREDVRMFRIDRIKNAEIKNDRFTLRQPNVLLRNLEHFFHNL